MYSLNLTPHPQGQYQESQHLHMGFSLALPQMCDRHTEKAVKQTIYVYKVSDMWHFCTSKVNSHYSQS